MTEEAPPHTVILEEGTTHAVERKGSSDSIAKVKIVGMEIPFGDIFNLVTAIFFATLLLSIILSLIFIPIYLWLA